MAFKGLNKLAAVMMGTLTLLSVVNPTFASQVKGPICTLEDTRQAVVDCFEYFKACESRNATMGNHTIVGDCGNTRHAWMTDPGTWPPTFHETFPVQNAVQDPSNQYSPTWCNLRFNSLMDIAISGDEEYGNLVLLVQELVSPDHYHVDGCCTNGNLVDFTAVTYKGNLTNYKNSVPRGRDEL